MIYSIDVYRGGLITLSHQPPTRSKRNQWMYAVLGLFYLAFGFLSSFVCDFRLD